MLDVHISRNDDVGCKHLISGDVRFKIWLVGCFRLNGPLRHISVYIRPSPKEREKEEIKDR